MLGLAEGLFRERKSQGGFYAVLQHKYSSVLYHEFFSKISVDSLWVRCVSEVDRGLALTHVTVGTKVAPWDVTTSG